MMKWWDSNAGNTEPLSLASLKRFFDYLMSPEYQKGVDEQFKLKAGSHRLIGEARRNRMGRARCGDVRPLDHDRGGKAGAHGRPAVHDDRPGGRGQEDLGGGEIEGREGLMALEEIMPITAGDAIESIKQDALDRGRIPQLLDAMWMGMLLDQHNKSDAMLTNLDCIILDLKFIRMCRLVHRGN